MNDQGDQEHDQLEHLLRRWGAQEASRQSDVPLLPFQTPARLGPWAMLRRWSPLIAASIILAVAAALFIQRPARQKTNPDAVLQARLTELTHDLEISRAALAETKRQLAVQKHQSEDQIVQLRQAIEVDKQMLLAEAQKQTTALDAMAAEKELLEKQTSQLTTDFSATQLQLEKLRAEFTAETTQLRQAHEEAVSAQGKAQGQLKAFQDQQREILALFQRTYLATADADGRGLLVRRDAARRERFIDRGILLRDTVRSRKSQRLFDTLEVVLTRLEMLDVQDKTQLRSFAQLLRSLDMVSRINETLMEWEEPSDARAWLIEIQLLLTGAENAV